MGVHHTAGPCFTTPSPLPPVEAGCPTDTINHAMVVVGYNFNAPTPYWIVRNSWGSGWGASGYILVEATDDTVGACRM